MQGDSNSKKATENEAVFRRSNEKMTTDMANLERIAETDNQREHVLKSETPLFFICECSNEKCRERLQVNPVEYATVHHDRRCFVILPGHENLDVEVIIDKLEQYFVVKKFAHPSERSKTLQRTE